VTRADPGESIESEEELRSASWLRCRFRDLARTHEPRTRARAFLDVAASRIQRIREADTTDADRRARFFELVDTIEKIASGAVYLGCYERVGGVDYTLTQVRGFSDPRLLVISEAARMAKIRPSKLDEAAARAASAEDSAARECAEFMRGFPKHVERGRCVVSSEAPTRPRGARYDDSSLVNILAAMPDRMSWRDRAEFGGVLLGDLGDTGPDPEALAAPKASSAAVLVASLMLLELAEARLRRAVAAKAQVLSTEFARATGSETKYLLRSQDLDAELVQDIREECGHLRYEVTRAAHRHTPMKRWPGSREHKKSDRAIELARRVRAASPVHQEELEQAIAQLGYGAKT